MSNNVSFKESKNIKIKSKKKKNVKNEKKIGGKIKNLKPSRWGKFYWGTLYYAILSYPIDNPTKEQQLKMKLMLENLILPCEECRLHYGEYVRANPISDEVLYSRINLLHWIINLNNEVNKRLGKDLVSYNDIVKKYLGSVEEEVGGHSKEEIINMMIGIVVILLIVVVLN